MRTSLRGRQLPLASALLGLMVVVFLVVAPAPAQAQDPDERFVDLLVKIYISEDYDSGQLRPFFFVVVFNEGNLPAKDVEVEVALRNIANRGYWEIYHSVGATNLARHKWNNEFVRTGGVPRLTNIRRFGAFLN